MLNIDYTLVILNFLSLCQISSEGDYNHTKVYIMLEKSFG